MEPKADQKFRTNRASIFLAETDKTNPSSGTGSKSFPIVRQESLFLAFPKMELKCEFFYVYRLTIYHGIRYNVWNMERRHFMDSTEMEDL